MSIYSNNRYNKKSPNDAWYKIFQFVEPKSNILDIGCSSGKLGAALKKEKMVRVIGVDIDKQDIELAKKNLDDAHVVDIEKDDLSFLGTFDTIIMADVVEHLVDPVNALKKISRLLKKDGQLLFSIPNMANVTTRLELLNGRFEYKDFGLLDRTHIHFYDHKEVNRVFMESGFQVVSTDCTLREIPDDILKKDLKKIGIELTPTLKKILNSPEAVTYQFIGKAKLSKNPRKFKLNTTSPLDSISIHIDSLNKQLSKEISSRDKEIERLQEHAANLDANINAIYSSRSWKLLSQLHSVKRKILHK